MSSPRCVRILRTTRPSVSSAIRRRGPPQWSQISTSIANVRFISSGLRRTGLAGLGLGLLLRIRARNSTRAGDSARRLPRRAARGGLPRSGHDAVAPLRGGSEDPVVGEQVGARPRHESRESGDEVERLERDRRGAVAPVSAQRVDHLAVGCEREPLDLQRRASDVATQSLEALPVRSPTASAGLGREP